MVHPLARIAGLVLTVAFSTGVAFGFTYSVDGAAAGSVPSPYNDGTLITCTGPGTYTSTNVLSGYPIDAIHIGAPINNVINKLPGGGYQIVSPIFFSIDNGNPSPVGAANEIFVSNSANSGPPNGGYSTATIGQLTNGTSILPAIQSNLNLGLSGSAYNNSVDALSLSNFNPSSDMVFFSIGDLVPSVPNGPGSMQPRDIFVRFTSGGVAKVLDGVTDIGLFDGTKSALYDEIDAFMFVNTDNNPANDKFVTVTDPVTQQQVKLDLGDGILFSVSGNLPTPTDGSYPQYLPSLDPGSVYFSALDGSAPVLVINGQMDLGLPANTDIDALAAYSSSTAPEPGTLLLLGTGIMTFAGLLRRKRLND